MNLYGCSTLTKFWLLNAPVKDIAEFCKDYGYEITILSQNNYILERRLGR